MIQIDYKDKRPLYEQVEERLRALIIKDVLKQDEKLPSVRALGVELAINPNTIQRAYAQLESNGFIYTVKGRGNFVASKTIWEDSEKKEILEAIKTAGKKAWQVGIAIEEVIQCIQNVYSTQEGGAG